MGTLLKARRDYTSRKLRLCLRSADWVMALCRQESGSKPQAACIAVAGPVTDDVCKMTNLSWTVDGKQLASAFDMRAVRWDCSAGSLVKPSNSVFRRVLITVDAAGSPSHAQSH